MSSPCSMAIIYLAKEYDTQRERLMGRHSASESFLKAWALNEHHQELFSFSRSQEDHDHFRKKIGSWSEADKNCRGITGFGELIRNNLDALYTPDPNLARGAWGRTAYGPASFSMIGVTHTLSSDGAMDLIGNLTTSPVEPWDALICTSKSVKGIVEKLISRQLDHLRRNFRVKEDLNPKLPQFPIIPLGVDVDRYPEPSQRITHRNSWRKKLGISDDSVVSLFMGRLSFHAKAHPYPMFEALERCTEESDEPLVLILCGWFANESTRDCFSEAANKICPSVKIIFVDGRNYETQNTIWAAADIFISLSDNIQETFGLTPLEAMANGLPVVVSDWDGYRETVRHGEDGFRARTITSPPGSGEHLARLHGDGSLNYDAFLMETCQQVVVDTDEVTRHLGQLISHPQLREDMGRKGRQRVMERFQWNYIVTQYQGLLSQLRELRLGSSLESKRPVQHPLRPDPFELHSHYASTHLEASTVIRLGSSTLRLQEALSLKLCQPIIPLNPNLINTCLEFVKRRGAVEFASLKSEIGIDSKDLTRHVMLLSKYGYLRLESPPK